MCSTFIWRIFLKWLSTSSGKVKDLYRLIQITANLIPTQLLNKLAIGVIS